MAPLNNDSIDTVRSQSWMTTVVATRKRIPVKRTVPCCRVLIMPRVPLHKSDRWTPPA